MNRLIQLKRTTPVSIALLLACFGPMPLVQAVVPAPDGGYPGGNTAEGQNALLSLTAGGFNTAVGFLSLRSDTTNSFNTAVGAGALLANIADQNTATGAGALLSNTSGDQSTANGAFALFSNTTGSFNTAIGSSALKFNTAGGLNTAIGFGALFQNTTGVNNTGIGFSALQANTTGQGNIALGHGAGGSVTTADNVIAIGADGANVDNGCYIGNIFNQASVNGIAVIVNSANKLGTTVSSKRFKEEIKPMNNTSEVVFALKPVTFRYTKELDPHGTPQFGLVAEDVEKANRNLVVHDKEGRPCSVRYDQVNAMLLNEFLKEHKKGEQQDRKMEELEATVGRLESMLKEHAAQIQKVSAQIEISPPAPRMVVSGR